jgi:hypothetical protein
VLSKTARHNRSSEALESCGLLGQAPDERKIALNIDLSETLHYVAAQRVDRFQRREPSKGWPSLSATA